MEQALIYLIYAIIVMITSPIWLPVVVTLVALVIGAVIMIYLWLHGLYDDMGRSVRRRLRTWRK